MPETKSFGSVESLTSALLDSADATLVDLVDNLLDKGIVLDAELVLGLAGIDLVYVRLAALLCAADRVTGSDPRPR